jgi:hypothetical protein
MASKALTTLNQKALDQPASSPVPEGTKGAVDPRLSDKPNPDPHPDPHHLDTNPDQTYKFAVDKDPLL